MKTPYKRVIGVDVSSETLDVNDSITQSKSRIAAEISNTVAVVSKQIVARIQDRESVLVICEATGGYEHVLDDAMHDAGIDVCVANPRQTRDFAKELIEESLTHLKTQQKKLDERIAEVIREREKTDPTVKILHSIPDIGVVTVSTLVATRHNKLIKSFYERLVAKGKLKAVALTAAMRKLLTILNDMVRNGECWRSENVSVST